MKYVEAFEIVQQAVHLLRGFGRRIPSGVERYVALAMIEHADIEAIIDVCAKEMDRLTTWPTNPRWDGSVG